MAEPADPGTPAGRPAADLVATRPMRLDPGALTDGSRPVSWYRPQPQAVMEGVERRRREIERKRREWKREQELVAAEAREGWERVWKTVAILVVLLGVGFAYWKLQLNWGNRWPLMDVWLWAAAGVMGVIWWALRAIGKNTL